MTQNTNPLDGIRVIDFSRVLAGPLCTMILGDLGADVIKVEHPAGGDDTRAWGPPFAGGHSAYYLAVNRNKRSLALDLKQPRGQQIARELIRDAQIVVENMRPGGMVTFGLDYDRMRQINPAIVYCSISGFGQDDTRPGYDFIIQALSGLMSITGPADGNAYKVGVAVSDVFTGLFAGNAIQAALRHAERTGQGQQIDMSLLESQVAALVNISSNVLISGQDAPRHGNAHPNIVPYQVFYAADQPFVIGVGNDRQFRRLCDLINRPTLADDPRFKTNPDRVHNRTALIDQLNAIFPTRPAAAWVTLCLEAGIPAGQINTVRDALNDARLVERGFIQTMTLDNETMVKLVDSPMHLSLTPTTMRHPPPGLGQHTDQILQDLLAYDPETLAELRRSNIIA